MPRRCAHRAGATSWRPAGSSSRRASACAPRSASPSIRQRPAPDACGSVHSMIAHIAKRIAFVVIGYLVGLVASAAAFPGILFLISLLKPASQFWQYLGLGPIAVVVAPVILVYIMSIVL